MEKITYLNNGQWVLEKAKAKDSSSARRWMHSGMRDHLDSLPAAEGKDRLKSLNLINNETDSRINPESGEKEFKLFRAANKDRPAWDDKISSWTTNPDMAHYWGTNLNTVFPGEKVRNTVVNHAWIPEKHIHSHLNAIVGNNHEKAAEQEVLVHPHKINVFHTEIPVKKQT